MNKLRSTLTLLTVLAAAHPVRADPMASITVEHAWLRATPKGAKVAGGYAVILNKGTVPDRLLSAGIAPAPTGEIHSMSMENGVMHMGRLDQGLVIPPGASVTLQPAGYHLMFMNPTTPLNENETVKGTLTFEKAGTIPVTFAVAGMAAKTAPGSSDHGGSDHGAIDMKGVDMKGMNMEGAKVQ